MLALRTLQRPEFSRGPRHGLKHAACRMKIARSFSVVDFIATAVARTDGDHFCVLVWRMSIRALGFRNFAAISTILQQIVISSPSWEEICDDSRYFIFGVTLLGTFLFVATMFLSREKGTCAVSPS